VPGSRPPCNERSCFETQLARTCTRRQGLLFTLLASCAPPPISAADRAPIPDPRPVEKACPRRLGPEAIDEAIALGTSFLLNNQRPEGNFAYLYDWRTQRDDDDDSPVRQAGALWALALLHRRDSTPELRAALDRGLAFFDRHTVVVDQRAHVNYPGFDVGRLGTVCLLGLAYLDRRRVVDDPVADARLRALLDFVKRARRTGGGFHQAHTISGRAVGARSPYFDGEALLFLTRAAQELDPTLGPLALDEADRGHHRHVTQALRRDPDSSETKGYYQWCSMALSKLAPDHPRMGDRLLRLAVWMVDVHQTLSRRRNTAYAYEGLVVAYAEAERRGDDAMVRKLGCVIEQGLAKLMSWQVGFSDANRAIAGAGPVADRRARGGVQNHAVESGLRIDVTQHQMHALLLAREHYLD